MLVLSRKVGEKILIGDGIAVTVVRVGPGVVRLGIEAPNDTPVVREEIRNPGVIGAVAAAPSDGKPVARSRLKQSPGTGLYTVCPP